MSSSPQKEWVLPAAIPFASLKRQDLEECVFWLLDAMGAKDLEWRLGGTGGGASDGGRDLEAQFYAPGADGELESQKWWVECKGRKGTVEPDEVKSAVNNALGKEGLDYLVVATNTQFSNPTRDWVKEWQRKHPRPKVKLWDASQLERYLSKHPDVVLRLFSEALSPEGRFQALETGFWNRMDLVPAGVLANLWRVRDDTEISAMGIFAATACEFAHGSIAQRPWGAILEARSLLEVLAVGLINIPYLANRCKEAGVDQSHIFRPMAYLTLVALNHLPAEKVAEFLTDQVCRGKPNEMPDEVKQMLIEPIVGQLQAELQDVCASDCSRVSMFDRATLTAKDDEVENYWARLREDGADVIEDRRVLRIEAYGEPCRVGFELNKEVSCPLFEMEPKISNLPQFLGVIKRVADFRRSQAEEKAAKAKIEATEREKIAVAKKVPSQRRPSTS